MFATLWNYIFSHLRRITFKRGTFTNFKALFPVVSTDFLYFVRVNGWNTIEKSIDLCFDGEEPWGTFDYVIKNIQQISRFLESLLQKCD